MNESNGPKLSVRGEARTTVAPDFGSVHTVINLVRASKAEALRDAAATIEGLLADLSSIGAVATTLDADRRPLDWLVQAVTTSPEYDHDKMTGSHGPTGRVNVMAS